MSDYSRETGKAKRILKNASKEMIERWCHSEYERLYGETLELPEHSSSWLDTLNDKSYYMDDKDYYFVIEDELWKVEDLQKKGIRDSYCELKKINEDEYEFDTQYYNGGTCWSEMLEDELKELKGKE